MALERSIVPYIGIRFLATSRPLLSNGLKFFMVMQDIIIYRLAMRSHDFDASKKSYFWQGNRRGCHGGGKGPLIWVDLLGQPLLSRKTVFKNVVPKTPLSLTIAY